MINYHKSTISFSRNTGNLDRKELSEIFNVRKSDYFGKYLGLPFFIGRNKKAIFDFIEKKIKQRLSGWYKKLLS